MKKLKLLLLIVFVSLFVGIPSSTHAMRASDLSWVECVYHAARCYWFNDGRSCDIVLNECAESL